MGGIGNSRAGVVVVVAASPHIPGLDDPALRAVDVVLLLEVLDAYAHPVLREHHVVPRHALLRVAPYLGYADVDLVPDGCDDRHDRCGDYEGDELAPDSPEWREC